MVTVLGRRRVRLVLHLLAVVTLTVSLIGWLGADSRGAGVAVPSADEAHIARAVESGIVDITATLAYPPWGHVWATGVILDSAGDVVTNNHVVAGSRTLTLQVSTGGPSYRGIVVGTDITDDLALVRMVGAHDLQPVALGDAGHLAVGQQVYAIGNGRTGCTIPQASRGSITALNCASAIEQGVGGNPVRLDGLVLSDIAVQPGESGGALVDTGARVVGILTAGACPAAYGYRSVYAIPIDKAAGIVDRMKAGIASATVHIGPTASLGVAAAPLFDVAAAPAITDALITYREAGSAAESSGLQVGDRIVSIDDSPIRSALDLATTLQALRPGDPVRVGWLDQREHEGSGRAVLAAGPAALVAADLPATAVACASRPGAAVGMGSDGVSRRCGTGSCSRTPEAA